MENIFKKEIQAILPVYIKNKGNCTLIYLKEKNIIVEKVIKTVINNLCKYHHLDLKASNKTYGDLLSIKKYQPIPFNRDNIFIQAKTRIPIGKHDGAYGYINIDAIEEIQESEASIDKTTILLKNGQSIEVLCKKETLIKNIKNGEIVKRLIRNKDNIIRESEELYLEENLPATKKDIAMIYMKLMEIKNRIK